MFAPLCCLALCAKLEAQDMPAPVRWSFEAEMVDDTTYQLRFIADIDEGWYLYAQDLEEGGPIPTTIAFYEHPEVRLHGPIDERGEVIEGMDALFQMNVRKYKNRVVFVQEATIPDGVEVVSGYIEFMTCDEEKCLPPTEIPFAFSFRG